MAAALALAGGRDDHAAGRVAGRRRGHDQPGVREMACRLNGDGKNFDKAAANLARTAQVQLSGETLRVLVEAEGKRVLQAQRSGRLAVGLVGGGLPHRGGDDAGLLRQRRRHGADGDRRREGVAAAEGQGEAKQQAKGKTRARRPGRCRRGRRAPTSGTRSSRSSPSTTRTQEHRLVCGTRGDHEVAGRLMRREAARIRLDLADEKVGNVDGSPWIRNQVRAAEPAAGRVGAGLLPPQRERPQGAAGDLRRGRRGGQAVGRPACSTSSSTRATRRPGSSLLEWRVGLRPGQRPAADRLVNYVSERREMIRYPEFQAKGWQIGSGPTEATCKTLTARLKGSGTPR